MSYLEKEVRMLQEMERTHYATVGGEEAKEDALSFMGDQFDTFIDYANTVIRQQVMIPIWRTMYDGQDLRDKLESIDQTRRIEHDAAIGGVNILNRMADRLGLEPFADIDTSDRYAVADFIGTYVNEVYNQGIGKTLDSAIVGRDREYTMDKKTSDQITSVSAVDSLEDAVAKLQRSELNMTQTEL